MIDAATFIDPVVPIDSNRAAGAAVKGGIRKASLWYVGWVTHQISQFASAVSRTLHIVEGRLKELERQVEAQRIPHAEVVEFDGAAQVEAWWVGPAIEAVRGQAGRTLHSACGDGWLVRAINDAGGDAYGVDPRSAAIEIGLRQRTDLREESLLEHLGAVAPAGLAAVVLSGIVEGLAGGEREQLLGLIANALAPGGALVVHSVTRARWESADAPVEADLAPGHPLRPDTWIHVLTQRGYTATAHAGPDGTDYVVTAVAPSVDFTPSA
jgi:hypothetical protein